MSDHVLRHLLRAEQLVVPPPTAMALFLLLAPVVNAAAPVFIQFLEQRLPQRDALTPSSIGSFASAPCHAEIETTSFGNRGCPFSARCARLAFVRQSERIVLQPVWATSSFGKFGDATRTAIRRRSKAITAAVKPGEFVRRISPEAPDTS